MDPQPKRPIEKLLQASASDRRAAFGTEPSMPGPMRTRLHEEISRRERERESRGAAGTGRSWLARIWPQISLATVAAIVLASGATIWMRNQRRADTGLQLAMKAPAPAAPTDA